MIVPLRPLVYRLAPALVALAIAIVAGLPMAHAGERKAALAHFTVGFENRASHLVDIEARYSGLKGANTVLFMPVWTPGSYLVRDHARQVQRLVATDEVGNVLRVDRPDTHRWRVHHGKKTKTITVNYQLYAREMSVRTNFVDADFALLNGAATWLLPVDRDGITTLTVRLPEDWPVLASPLPANPGDAGSRQAPDRDTLIDSPLLAGPLVQTAFEVAGVPHTLVDLPPEQSWLPARAAADLTRIAEAARAVFGALPTDLDHYFMLNVLAGGGGGLEHAFSAVLMDEPHVMASTESYRDWLRLAAHEYFHLWNVKRLRPVALGPFDYERAVLTDSLWIAEGITAYYDGLLVLRAGLSTETDWFEALQKKVERLDNTPGAEVRSLALASRDAWIRAYRPDENSVNSDVSYYLKGALVAWLLDAEIRLATDHARSLDDLMRLAASRHSGARGYTDAQFEAAASEVAGRDLSAFFDAAVRGTEPLDFTPALKAFGLRFKPKSAPTAKTDEAESTATDKAPVGAMAPKPGDGAKGPERPEARPASVVAETPKPPGLAVGSRAGGGAWLGMEVHLEGTRSYVAAVSNGTPAQRAGLAAGDELLGIAGQRVPDDGPDALLARLQPETAMALLVSRRGHLRSLSATSAAMPVGRGVLEVDPTASEALCKARRAWMRPDR